MAMQVATVAIVAYESFIAALAAMPFLDHFVFFILVRRVKVMVLRASFSKP